MEIAYLMVMTCLSLVALNHGDDSPGFFLKVTKNIPRLGRRSLMKFFDHATSHRIDRRSEYNKPSDFSLNEDEAWLNEIPTPSKRMLLTPMATIVDREYSVVQPVNSNTLIELLDKDAIPSEIVKFVHWKDFDRALQNDYDLYAKVISLGRIPDQHLKEELRYSGSVDIPLFGNGNHEKAANDAILLYNQGYNQAYPKAEQSFSNSNNLK